MRRILLIDKLISFNCQNILTIEVNKLLFFVI